MKIGDQMDSFASFSRAYSTVDDLPDFTVTKERIRETYPSWGSEQIDELANASWFAFMWKMGGRVVLQLDHSIAALLAATRAPAIELENLSFPAFIIDVPSDFFPGPREHGPRIYLGMAAIGPALVFGATAPGFIGNWEAGRRVDSVHEDLMHRDNARARMTLRILANVNAFVSQHRECVERVSGHAPNATQNVSRVSCPRDVIVDRAFRDSVRTLVSANDIAGVRRALAHIVRGHWRNQPVGEGRKDRRMTWVRPHKRGDESLGRVVERIHRLT